ncbi:MAG: 30S ribosomal protein S21 [bacterium]
MIQVQVQPNESIDSALKRFNRQLQQSGILRELKEHAHYEKPSDRKRRKARRRRR